MSLSVLLTAGSAAASALSYRVGRMPLVLNAAMTMLGAGLGIVLLINHPLDSKCIVLTTYLIAFVVINILIRQRDQALQRSSAA